MRPLTPQEKRTLRLGAIGVGVYLLLFGGVQLWRMLERRRSDYQTLVTQAQALKADLGLYETKTLVVGKLMKDYHLDPGKLARATVVAQASAAIQEAAMAGGIPITAVRESPTRSSGKELASMQIEAAGPVPAAMGLLARLQTLGYPVLIDSVQLTPQPNPPGMVKLNMTLVVLDFEQWKKKEAAHE
ncbi:MAG TPA: hypothetical protein VG167_15435 [Verrucomicrobiae bacterium]|nr:hypothetical protein [Verrucomicrobiae bacterium]